MRLTGPPRELAGCRWRLYPTAVCHEGNRIEQRRAIKGAGSNSGVPSREQDHTRAGCTDRCWRLVHERQLQERTSILWCRMAHKPCGEPTAQHVWWEGSHFRSAA
eukprot:scaffold851_cov22-Tisochrysis_lutea.AAC.1